MRKLTLTALLVCCVGGSASAQEDSVSGEDLRSVVNGFLASVADADQAGVADAVCLNWRADAYLQWAGREGIVEEGGEVAVTEDYIARYHQAVSVRYGDVIDRFGMPTGIDLSRVGEDAESEGGDVTASGVVGLGWDEPERLVDLSVERIGDSWCLNPVSVD